MERQRTQKEKLIPKNTKKWTEVQNTFLSFSCGSSVDAQTNKINHVYELKYIHIIILYTFIHQQEIKSKKKKKHNNSQNKCSKEQAVSYYEPLKLT